MEKENILNLIPKSLLSDKEKQKYTSKFSCNVKDELSKNKYAHRTMGEAEVKLNDPQNFLRRKKQDMTESTEDQKMNCENGNGEAVIDASNQVDDEMDAEIKDERGCDQKKSRITKPPVPKHDEYPVMGIRTTKNFITQNAMESITAVSRKPEKFVVDSRKGDKFMIEPSGLEKVYVNKKEYGKVPEYIDVRKEELARMQQEYDMYVAEMRQRGQMHRLSEDEIQEILHGLKKNWEGFYRQYQSLSVITDSLPKKNKKEYLENEMKELEKDIDMLERYQSIYVAN